MDLKISKKAAKALKDTQYNSDITQEDLKVLSKGFKNHIRQNDGVDVALTRISHQVDFGGKNLDVPGRSAASKNTTNRINDKENKLHSQGSASNENLEDQSKQNTK